MSFSDPKLRARLDENAREKVSREHYGDKGYYNMCIGLTHVHIDQGLVYTQINWGVDGLDCPVSPDVTDFVELYDLTGNLPRRADGIYLLEDRRKTALARARVKKHEFSRENESTILVTGEKRENVVKLFRLLEEGKIRPHVEQSEFDQIEGGLSELKRLRRENPLLKSQLENVRATVMRKDTQIIQLQNQLAGIAASARAS
jgi:hypothetical protein